MHRIAALLVLSAIPAIAEPLFEPFTIAPASQYRHNAYPTLDRLADGRLICTWAAIDKATGDKAVIVAAFSEDHGRTWTKPVVLIDSKPDLDYDPSIVVMGRRVIVTSTTVPPTHAEFISVSRTMAVRSDDDGRTWSKPYEIPMGHRYTSGKINIGVVLRDGSALLPYSWDMALQGGGKLTSEGQEECLAAVLISKDRGMTWTSGADAHTRDPKLPDRAGAINGLDEPAIVELGDGSVYMLCRTGATKLYECRSRDGGRTWSRPIASPLSAHNAPASLCRIGGEKPGILVVWDNSPTGRWPLCAAVSFDNCKTWTAPRRLTRSDGEETSYPACVDAGEGTFVIAWQHARPDGERMVEAVRVNLEWLLRDTSPEEKQRLSVITRPAPTGTWTGYVGKVDPLQASPPWTVHAAGGKMTPAGLIRLEPTGGYYINDRRAVWDGSSDNLVEARMRVIRRDEAAPGNHSAAELWIGGDTPNSGCELFFRENAVSFDPSFDPSQPVEATRLHTYAIRTDLKARQAYLFIDGQTAPVLSTSLGSPEGFTLNRVLFGDSSVGTATVSGISEWAFVRWSNVGSSKSGPGVPAGASPEWSVPSLAYRVLVEVPSRDIGKRASDAMPAALDLDFNAAPFTDLKLPAAVDLDSIQVVGYAVATGKPVPAPEWPFARSPGERASRFLDKSLPWQFPTAESRTPGEAVGTFERGAFLVNAKGTGNPGLITWDHLQQAAQPTRYAVYFDTLGSRRVGKSPRQGFVGDGSPRREVETGTLTGSLYNRVTVADWDGDGLQDLLVGVGFGYVLLYRNEGDRSHAHYGQGEYLRNADGAILNIGAMASPDVGDWNGDGVPDLVLGEEGTAGVFWYENKGTATRPRLVYRGRIQADGADIVIPAKPCPESPHYTKDYAPSVDVVDWNGDGKPDLLLGGYITGYIWYYENTGNAQGGTPLLKFRGPLESEARPIDTIWGAHPCAADFDGDGDLDLVTGTFGQAMGGGDAVAKFLRYYENVGTRTAPRLVERPVPYDGAAPSDILAQARAADLNGDGLPDLAVSTMSYIYIGWNTGTKSAPRWKFEVQQVAWGLAPLSLTQLIDWNQDGLPDLIRSPLDGSGAPDVQLNQGRSTHGVFGAPQPLLPERQEIRHPQPYGDPWAFVFLCDTDRDGDLDILWGDGPGNIYLHRNIGSAARPKFDTAGEKLLLTDGQAIKVGPPIVPMDQIKDFVVMQGSRAAMTAADFDEDGRIDLVVGDALGDVLFFANRGTPQKPVFAPGVKLGNIGSRAIPSCYDWDHDGHLDVVGIAWSGQMEWYRNQGPGAVVRFAAGKPLALPPTVLYSPRVVIADWNGDGDDDLLVMSSYPWFCWLEGSYVHEGYARARILAAEHRQGSPE